MSKYYNEYQSQRVKKRPIGLIVFIIVCLLIIAALVVFVIMPKLNKPDTSAPSSSSGSSAIGGSTEPSAVTALAAPANLTIDASQTKLSWTCAASAKTSYYLLSVNGVTTKVYDNPYTVNLTENVTSLIKIKAVPTDTSLYSESEWSTAISVVKQDAQTLAYNSIISNLKAKLNAKVTVKNALGASSSIVVNDLLTVNYAGYSADIWYTFTTTADADNGLACSTISSVNIDDGVVSFYDKWSQVASTLESQTITTKAYLFANEDCFDALLAREDFNVGTLGGFLRQGATLSVVAGYISSGEVTGETVSFDFIGILKFSCNNSTKYYVYNYCVSFDKVSGGTDDAYLDSIATADVSVSEKATARQISNVGTEMLNIYLGRRAQ